jgi:regulator of replication initiation timing
LEVLRRQVAELQSQMAQLQNRCDEFAEENHRIRDDLRQLKDALGG